jgi:Fe2+ or Zn2+ uptake regulation protein
LIDGGRKVENSNQFRPEGDASKAENLSFLPHDEINNLMTPSPVHEQILAIAFRMMEQHYVLDTDQLYKECKRVLKSITPPTLRAALQDLLNKRYLVEGKAVTRETLLENENRRRIFEIIKHEPGVYFSRIKEMVEKDSRTIQWHLDMLVEFNFIREVRFGNNVLYFDFLLEKQHDMLYYYLHKDGAPAIFKMILSTPGMSFQALLDTTQFPRSTLTRKVKALIEQGLLKGEYQSHQLASLKIREDCVPILQSCFSQGLFP